MNDADLPKEDTETPGTLVPVDLPKPWEKVEKPPGTPESRYFSRTAPRSPSGKVLPRYDWAAVEILRASGKTMADASRELQIPYQSIMNHYQQLKKRERKRELKAAGGSIKGPQGTRAQKWLMTMRKELDKMAKAITELQPNPLLMDKQDRDRWEQVFRILNHHQKLLSQHAAMGQKLYEEELATERQAHVQISFYELSKHERFGPPIDIQVERTDVDGSAGGGTGAADAA